MCGGTWSRSLLSCPVSQEEPGPCARLSRATLQCLRVVFCLGWEGGERPHLVYGGWRGGQSIAALAEALGNSDLSVGGWLQMRAWPKARVAGVWLLQRIGCFSLGLC